MAWRGLAGAAFLLAAGGAGFAATPAAVAPGLADAEGVSLLWRALYPGAGTHVDSDGDGFTDFEEAIAGTNPFDPTCRPRLELSRDPAGGLRLAWPGMEGKRYGIERFDFESGEWSEIHARVAEENGPQEQPLAPEEIGEAEGTDGRRGALFRLRVADVDQDGDGLTAWEEALLGFRDDSPTSSGQEGRHDYAAAFRLLEGEGELELADGRMASRRLPDAREAGRFLAQASFGADADLLEEVQSLGIAGWMDAQFAKPQTRTHATMTTNGQMWDAFYWRKGWLRAVMLGEDQLRQRMSYALSQIFVVNADTGSRIGDNPLVQARYYDLLSNGAFGNYREVLEDVTYSPVMGFYLSHLRNRKGDPAANRFPDENFAREIMQLFTIGLWELHPDGTRQVDENGDFIPTYDNEVITAMARVFTGLGFGTNGGAAENLSFFTGGVGNDYLAQMKMFDDQHDMDEKELFHGIVLPAGQSGEQDVADALDALCAHPSMAPFVSRLLIQRFTSSNPSPAYIRRVAAVWEDNGGDLRAVLEAILLDPEARRPAALGDESGKVREPLLRFTALLRAFRARNATHTFTYGAGSGHVMGFLGQYPLLSPSVFNFYSPDHQPAGELRERGLFAPELELATTSRLLLLDNTLRQAIHTNFSGLVLNFDEVLPLADDVDRLLDRLDELLVPDGLSAETRATIRTAVQAQATPLAKVRTAVHLIVESPDAVVLK